LVAAVGGGDARLGFVVDKKSGAKISMNLNDVPEPGYKGTFEPFYIESPDGENMYDPYNRREAIKLLSNIRKGVKYPDIDTASMFPARWQKRVGGRTKGRAKSGKTTSLRGLRR
jgi:hypothetical protein